jgi:hypothetical protein
LQAALQLVLPVKPKTSREQNIIFIYMKIILQIYTEKDKYSPPVERHNRHPKVKIISFISLDLIQQTMNYYSMGVLKIHLIFHFEFQKQYVLDIHYYREKL